MKKRKVQVVILSLDKSNKKVAKALLLQTNKKRGRFWQNVTGSVERYERFATAALRELWEETGLTEDDIFSFVDLKLTHAFTSRKGHQVSEKSFVVVVKEQNITLDPKEHERYKWLPIKLVRSTTYKFPTNFESFCLAKKCFKI